MSGPTTAVDIVRPVPTALEMIQAALAQGITSESVATVRELISLRREMDADEARRAFVADFIALQADIPTIKATKVIPDKHGGVRSSFAPFEEIDAQAGPICARHGFVYSFSEGAFQQGKITKICTLMHKGGHERSNPYSVRIGSGPPGCSESQADGSAHSYAKRGALCDALNVVVSGIDNDARMEGGVVTKEQADELERRVKETNSNREAFLKLGGAKDFASISSVKYDILDQLLRKKEARGK